MTKGAKKLRLVDEVPVPLDAEVPAVTQVDWKAHPQILAKRLVAESPGA